MLREETHESERWIDRLRMLCNKFSDHGISADLAVLSEADARHLYLRLIRLANGGPITSITPDDRQNLRKVRNNKH